MTLHIFCISCLWGFSGINQYRLWGWNLFLATATSQGALNLVIEAVLVVHEIGHSLGRRHNKWCHTCNLEKCMIGGSDSSYCCDDCFDWVSSGLEYFRDMPLVSVLQEQCANKLVWKREGYDWLHKRKWKRYILLDFRRKHDLNCTLRLHCKKCSSLCIEYLHRKKKNEYHLEKFCTEISEEHPIDVYI